MSVMYTPPSNRDSAAVAGPWFYKMDDHGETPMSRAKRCGYRALAEFLLRHEKQETQIEEGPSQLHRAAYWGMSNAVVKLLDEGARPGERDETGATPLVKAVRNGHWETVQALLDHGVDANECGPDGMTPLHWVSLNGRRDLAVLLLEQGADINQREHEAGGLTPMGIALLMGYDDLVALFGSRGAAV